MYCTFLGWTGLHHRIYHVGSWIDLCNGIGIDNFCFPSNGAIVYFNALHFHDCRLK